ncbi:amino acid ABC transporter permease [Leucobacter sp. CSA2]|uniref:Amino acid ABC transporter permease n=1 Tax=Leucobacter edaphi TaxID=2796472 RepID=A0A934QEM8_9MICO|nr:amino acid ABC transporter permease [Leucobacter edaphi]MBK0421747.1 amino acid ABC transporter permease [Leucobacter edaphi]
MGTDAIIDFGAIGKYALDLLPYIPITLALSVLATVLGTVLGLGFALIKLARVPVLSQLTAVLVSYLRGTPPLVQLLLNVNAVPILILYANHAFGTQWNALALNPFLVAAVTFALTEAAYSSETIRAALLSVDRREVEAAHALGMTPWQTLRRITIPVASVVAFPTLVNHFIGMLKQSSLAFVVSVVEITAFAKILGGRDYRYFEAYLATAIIYWALTVIVEQLARIIERQMQRPRVPGRSPRPGRGTRPDPGSDRGPGTGGASAPAREPEPDGGSGALTGAGALAAEGSAPQRDATGRDRPLTKHEQEVPA